MLRNYGFRRQSSHLDANASLVSGSIVALNLITTLLLATCAILHLPYASHAQWLLEEGPHVMNAAHASSTLNIDESRGSIISLVISSWVAIFTLSLKWLHLHGTPLNCTLALAFIVIARAANFRSMACRIRDNGLPATLPVPRSLRGWSRLLDSIQGKGRLLGSDCSICLNKMTGLDEVIVANCGHGYHYRCLDTWEVTVSSQRVIRGSPLPLSSPTSSGIDCGGLWRRRTATTQQQQQTTTTTTTTWYDSSQPPLVAANLSSCPLCRASRSAVVLPRRTTI